MAAFFALPLFFAALIFASAVRGRTNLAPAMDAQQALKKGDFRLLGLATRSVNIPGVTKQDSLKYELKCGVQLIDGISDVIRSDEHLRLMQKARSYALKYNAIIKTRCQP